MGSPINFAEIARRFGGKAVLASHQTTQPTPQPQTLGSDYSEMARQFGGKTLIQTPPKGPNVQLPKGTEWDDPLTMAVGFTKGLLGGEQAPGVTPSGFGALFGAALPVAGGVKALRATKTATTAENAVRDGIIAYHGSPHDFDRFSLDKIGTGEGAQAYGHGLYFADNEKVARNYRDTLSSQLQRPSDTAHVAAAKSFLESGYSKPSALEGMRKAYPSASVEELEAAMRAASGLDSGRMYEVKINASPDQLLDWDSPIGVDSPLRVQLGKEAKSALAKASTPEARNAAKDALMAATNENTTGEGLYNQLANLSDVHKRGAMPFSERKAFASQRLAKIGVPGIKYLDGASRLAGAGSRNYVVFDDSLIDVLKKYGIALPALGMLSYEAKKNGGMVDLNTVNDPKYWKKEPPK